MNQIIILTASLNRDSAQSMCQSLPFVCRIFQFVISCVINCTRFTTSFRLNQGSKSFSVTNMESQLQISGQVGSQERSFRMDESLEPLQVQLEADAIRASESEAMRARESEAYRERVRCLPNLPGKDVI